MDNPGEKSTMVNDIKIQRRHAKQLRKVEKKLKKEEEFLKNLRKPKDTKVILADRSLLEKLGKESLPTSSNHKTEFTDNDFPELAPSSSSSKKTKHKSPMTYKSVVNSSNLDAFFPPVEEKDNKSENDKRFANASDTTGYSHQCGNAEKLIPTQGTSMEISNENPTEILKDKKTKKKDPIVVNIGDLLTKKKSKEENKELIHGRKLRKKLDKVVIYGNMLDSSNPKRSRGKRREIEKKTFSKLKLAIMRDRIMKLKARENPGVADEMTREQFKQELDLYLSDLMKKLELVKAQKTSQTANHTSDKAASENQVPDCEKKGKSVKSIKYRKYCNNKYSGDLDESAKELIKGIVYLQDRAFAKDPIKARAKQRHVVGLREIKKCLMLNKVKMLIIAPDLEAQESVYNVIEELKKTAALQNIPVAFCLSRRILGQVSKKSVPVSAFGILNYDGLENEFVKVKDKLSEAQEVDDATLNQ